MKMRCLTITFLIYFFINDNSIKKTRRYLEERYVIFGLDFYVLIKYIYRVN